MFSTIYVVYLVVVLIWQFGKSHKDRQIDCMPLSSLLYFKHPYNTEIRQFKIPPMCYLSYVITKYLTRQ